MDYEVVKYEVAEGVATVTLEQPGEAQHALRPDAGRAGRRDEAGARRGACAAVVLTGAGDKVFCAGADLGGFAADVPLVAKHFATDLFLEFFRLMPRLGKPSLCAANGHVLAGGYGPGSLLRPPDRQGRGALRHAGDQRRRVPVHDHVDHLPQRAAEEGHEMMLSGKQISAEQAVEYGLANKVVPAEKFHEAVWTGPQARLEEPGADAPRP
jgi:enoyl-CoA hydratase/carnithine racemase